MHHFAGDLPLLKVNPGGTLLVAGEAFGSPSPVREASGQRVHQRPSHPVKEHRTLRTPGGWRSSTSPMKESATPRSSPQSPHPSTIQAPEPTNRVRSGTWDRGLHAASGRPEPAGRN